MADNFSGLDVIVRKSSCVDRHVALYDAIDGRYAVEVYDVTGSHAQADDQQIEFRRANTVSIEFFRNCADALDRYDEIIDQCYDEMPEFNYGGNPCGADGCCPYRFEENGKIVCPCMEMCGVKPIEK